MSALVCVATGAMTVGARFCAKTGPLGPKAASARAAKAKERAAI